MNQYEIVLTGEDLLAQLQKLCTIEPGVYGKRWNPDGSLTVLVRSNRGPGELQALLDRPSFVEEKAVEAPKARPARRLDSLDGPEAEA